MAYSQSLHTQRPHAHSPRAGHLTTKALRIVVTVVAAIVALLGVSLAATPAQGAEKPSNNQEVALKISDTLDRALEALDRSDFTSAYREVQNAYFKYYDPLLEGPSMTLRGNRKPMMEGLFGKAKAQIKAEDSATARTTISSIRVNVARDALELDGVIADDLPDSEKDAAAKKLLARHSTTEVTSSARSTYSFITAFTILLREGLEALLVVAAIVLYLVRSGNKHLTKYVYGGVGLGILCSVLLAILLGAVFENAGAGQELLEGATMFLAVLVLFYISHWMLSKSSALAWDRYVRSKVDRSVSTGNLWLLVFAAFLAVIREGAELVLFYSAAFSGDMSTPVWVGIGIAAAAGVLAIIFVVFRFFAVKLPIGIVFKVTSTLLFLLAIVFVGNGVIELGEAGFIIGQTSIPSLSWLTLPIFGIYPRAETLLPQLILVIAAVWLTISQTKQLRRQKHEHAEAAHHEAGHDEAAH